MKLQTIKYFVVLAEELHFGRAASKLFITQPPLSTAIKSLENELGIILFNRNKTNVSLTDPGKAFLTEAIGILESVERAKHIATSTKNGFLGNLNIGFCGTIIFRDTLKIIKDFKSLYKNININLMELNSIQQIDALNSGKINIGFRYGSEVPAPLKCIAWRDDIIDLCMPSNHPKANKESVDLQDFREEEFIMFERYLNPRNYDTVMQCFSRENFSPKISFLTKNWMTSLAMVSEGWGIALVPRSLNGMKMDGIKIVPMTNNSTYSASCVAWNANKSSPTLNNLLEFLKEKNFN